MRFVPIFFVSEVRNIQTEYGAISLKFNRVPTPCQIARYQCSVSTLPVEKNKSAVWVIAIRLAGVPAGNGNYKVNHKKGGSTIVIITLENIDRFL